MIKLVSSIVVALLLCDVASAIVMPHIISDHMVLPRAPNLARIWGYETPGGTVTVRHGSTVLTSVADAKGDWVVTLPPTGIMLNQVIVITTSLNASQIITVKDVAFGDIHFCAGQSNMEMTVGATFDAKELIADSINHPNIRLFPIRRELDKTAYNDTKSRYGPQEPWQRAAPQYLNGTAYDYFSAVCYIYGLGISNGINGQIPIGLVESAYGGSKIALWTSPDSAHLCGGPKEDKSIGVVPSSIDLNDDVLAINDPMDIQYSVLFLGEVNPVLNFQFTSIVFYQGESNAENATLYRCQFPIMIKDWRTKFNLPYIKFYFVLQGPTEDPYIRDAQLTGLQEANVSVASAIDLGDMYSPLSNLQSRNKTILGMRLANIALNQIYGQTERIYSGPTETSPYIYKNTTSNRIVSLQLNYAINPDTQYNNGLTLSGTAQCWKCCTNSSSSPIQFLLKDSTTGLNVSMIRSNITINKESLIASADLSLYKNTVYVDAFAIQWENQPQCVIVNSKFIPQLPSWRILETQHIMKEIITTANE